MKFRNKAQADEERMMHPGEESVILFQRFLDGEDAAAAMMFNRYFQRLDDFANRRMSGPLQQRVGSDDIAQSVYCSFFKKAQEGVFAVGESGQLWKMLAGLAYRKIQQNVEWHGVTNKRSYQQERSLESKGADVEPSVVSEAERVEFDDAIAAILATISPQWQTILAEADLATNVDAIAAATSESATNVRKVLILRMKCDSELSNEELGEILGCAAVTVRRIWRDLLAHAEAMCNTE